MRFLSHLLPFHSSCFPLNKDGSYDWSFVDQSLEPCFVISNKENGLSRGLGSRTQGTDSSLLYSSSGVECPTTSYFFWTRDKVPYMILDQMLCERRMKRNGKTKRVMERRKSSDPCGLGDDSPAIGLIILTCASGPYIRYIHFILLKHETSIRIGVGAKPRATSHQDWFYLC